MVFYRDLRNRRLFSESEKDWVSRRLLDLRARLRSPAPDGVPQRTRESSLIIGTWNIRDFDNNKYRHGPRRRESLLYIAEIISAFDVCAIQEVNEDLEPLRQILRLMGPDWDFIATDVTVGASGNRERMAFVYDKSKISFRHIAGEIVLPKHALLPDERQFARTPFMVSFQAGWFKFSLCTVHIYFGSNSKNSDGYQRRVAEIDYIAKEMARRAEREDENYILLGDFNIKNTMDETMHALTKAGFILPPELFPSNILGTKYYDQIAFRTRKDECTFLSAGAFNFTEPLFTEAQYEHYAPILPERHRDLGTDGTPKDRGKDKDYFRKRWMTWQMSDHLPLWVELAIDFADEHLLSNLAENAIDRPAQREFLAEPDDLSQHHGEAPDIRDETTDAPPEPPLPDKARKRRKPKVAAKAKVGTARPNPRLTLKEAWQIFWFVATGKADAIRRERKAEEQAARKKKPSKAK
ncbi:MAG: endonuclease/exonuclease/phosphatase family protein [Pseudomonadota bacterium]